MSGGTFRDCRVPRQQKKKSRERGKHKGWTYWCRCLLILNAATLVETKVILRNLDWMRVFTWIPIDKIWTKILGQLMESLWSRLGYGMIFHGLFEDSLWMQWVQLRRYIWTGTKRLFLLTLFPSLCDESSKSLSVKDNYWLFQV